MNSFEVDGFLSFTLAIILLFIGKWVFGQRQKIRPEYYKDHLAKSLRAMIFR